MKKIEKLRDLKKLLESASDDTEIKVKDGEIVISEPQPKDITDRIKTFDDAVKWCDENGKKEFVREYYNIYAFCNPTSDLMAYLRLRIITAALNEGWEWEPGKQGDYGIVSMDDSFRPYFHCSSVDMLVGKELLFRTEKLAYSAILLFRDIYADFCGCKKGGEE